jgi:hypothetical protein
MTANNIRHLIKYLIASGVILLILFALNSIDFQRLDPEYPDFNANFKKQYKGQIINKYLDSSNHLFPTLDFKTTDNLIFKWRKHGHDSIGFYDFVNIGDSIIKDKWGFDFIVKRDDFDTIICIEPNYKNKE